MSLVKLVLAVLFLIIAFIVAATDSKDFIFGAMEWLVASIAVSLLPIAGVVVKE